MSDLVSGGLNSQTLDLDTEHDQFGVVEVSFSLGLAPEAKQGIALK